MEYIIHNKKVIGNKTQQQNFVTEIENKLPHIETLLKGYNKPVTLEIFLKKEGAKSIKIEATINLGKRKLVVKKISDNHDNTIAKLLETMAQKIKKEMPKIRKEHLYKRKRPTKRLGELLIELDKNKHDNSKEAFNETISRLLPALKRYVLNYLDINGKGKKAKLSIQEIIDEIYLTIFNKINQRPDDENQFVNWMFAVAKEWLDKNIIETQPAANEKQLDIQQLANKELKSLEERFTVDADEELIMFEDLDDISYFNEFVTNNYENEIDKHLITEADVEENVLDILRNLDYEIIRGSNEEYLPGGSSALSDDYKDVVLVDKNYKYNHLYVIDFKSINEDDSASKRITKGNFSITDFDWSPDGKFIVFSHQPDPTLNTRFLESDISVVPADSGEVKSLVKRPGIDYSPIYNL